MDSYIKVLRWEQDMLEDRLVNLKVSDGSPELINAYERRLTELGQKIQTEDNFK